MSSAQRVPGPRASLRIHRVCRIATFSLSALASGCAIVTSQPDGPDVERKGTAYMLPKALLPIELVEADGVMMLRMSAPTLVGDPSQRYFAVHQKNPFSSDDLKIEVDPATGLLAKITATGTDQTLDVVKQLALLKSARVAELGAGVETVLFSGHYDPDGDIDAQAATRNGALFHALNAAMASRLEDLGAAAGKDAEKQRTFAKMRTALKMQGGISVQAKPLLASAQTKASGDGKPSTCAIGVCYRALQPFEVKLSIPGAFEKTAVLQLPNQGAPIAVELDRAAFVKTEYVVELEQGQLKSVDTKRPSSALALASWPLDVYQSVLEATATLIQLRIGANEKEVELAQSKLTTLTELKRIDDELEKLKSGQAELSDLNKPTLSGPRQKGAVLSFEVGTRTERPRFTTDQTSGNSSSSSRDASSGQSGKPGVPLVPSSAQPAGSPPANVKVTS